MNTQTASAEFSQAEKATPRFERTNFGPKDFITTDAQTGLSWSHTLRSDDPTETDYAECLALVNLLNVSAFGGFTDWRMPSRAELLSIVDDTRSNPAIDTDAFPDTRTDDWYWTSTPAAGYEGASWNVNFNLGYSGRFIHYLTGFVRAVRGPVARPGQ